MTLTEFLFELAIFFPLRGAKTEKDAAKVIESYAEHLKPYTQGKNYDFKKLLRWVVDNYEYKTFPEVGFIKDHLYKGKIFNSNSEEGQLVVVTQPDDKCYQFTIANFGFNTIGEVRNRLLKRFGKPSKFQFYPAGTVIIGGQVFTPDE